MSWRSAGKWFGMHSGTIKSYAGRAVGFAIPVAASPWPVDNAFQAGPLARRFPNVSYGTYAGSGAALGMLWVQSGAAHRLADTVLQRGTGGAHWQDTPKMKFEARKRHGFFVSPGDRMQRGNAYSMDRWTVHKQDYAREGIVWMP